MIPCHRKTFEAVSYEKTWWGTVMLVCCSLWGLVGSDVVRVGADSALVRGRFVCCGPRACCVSLEKNKKQRADGMWALWKKYKIETKQYRWWWCPPVLLTVVELRDWCLW